MTAKAKKDERARFDTRLPKDQKLLFERAAKLGGYRSLTDFVVLTVQEKAVEIVREKEQILASEQDCEIFFTAITGDTQPNDKLISAVQEYKNRYSE